MTTEYSASRQIIALSVIRLIDGLASGILIVIVPLYVLKMPTTIIPLPEPVLIGIAVSFYSLVGSVLQPVMGALSDRIGQRKPFILLGFAIMAFTIFAYIFIDRFEPFVLFRMIQGVGLSLIFAAATGLMATITEQQSRGRAMGIYKGTRMLGLAIGPLLGGFLQVKYGFNASFLVGVAIMLIGLFLVQRWVKEKPNGLPIKKKLTPNQISRKSSTISLLALGISILFVGSNFAMVAVLKNEFASRLQMTIIDFSLAFSVFSLSRLIFQVPIGYLSDFIGHKRTILLGLSIMIPSTALLGLVHSTLIFTFLRFVQGLGSAGISAPALALAADTSESGSEGKQMSIVNMGFGLGSTIGPMIASVLVLVSFEFTFLINAFLTFLGALVVYQYVPSDFASKNKLHLD
jgi:MFS family permease